MHAKTSARKSALRRVPTQERSKKRLEAILDAAAAEFAARGFDAATMEDVADRAGTSIGSVYAFFPNKLALFQALAAQTLERSNRVFAEVVEASRPGAPWTEVVDGAIDAFAALQADPTFRAIWMNMQLYGVFAKEDAGLHRSFVERTAALIARQAPHVRAEERGLVASMVVHAISALLYVAARSKPEDARRIVRETKVMIRRYLAPVAAPPGDAPREPR